MYGTARQERRPVRIACWVTKATQTHTQNMKYLILLHNNNGKSKRNVIFICTLSDLLVMTLLI